MGRPRKPKRQTVANSGRPECPEHMSDAARDEWDRVCGELEEAGILGRLDRALLAAYCEAWEEFVELSVRVRKEGATVETDKGNIVQNPTLGAKNSAAERLIRIAANFGMSPAARAKLEAVEKSGDELGDFVKPRLVKRG